MKTISELDKKVIETIRSRAPLSLVDVIDLNHLTNTKVILLMETRPKVTHWKFCSKVISLPVNI
ncbi:hypothetical protein CWB66_03665 [Pseudoalteromonas sp. S558]|nr:hypothetical protein CWB66_03665 [Pseudoalteromonas sp. S558]